MPILLLTVEQQLVNILKKDIESFGYDLWGIQVKSMSRNEMRIIVYVDKETGINLEELVAINHQLNAVLKVEAAMQREFSLEVSSPGLDRFLFTNEQLTQYIGKQIKVVTKLPVNGRKNFKGMLQAVRADLIELMIDNQNYQLAQSNIKTANVVPSFNQF